MAKYTAYMHAKNVNGMDVHEDHENRRVEAVYLAMFWLSVVQTLIFAKSPEQCVLGTHGAYGWTICVFIHFCQNMATQKMW